jgi:hypothetical protein
VADNQSQHAWRSELHSRSTLTIAIIVMISAANASAYGQYDVQGLMLLLLALVIGVVMLPGARNVPLSKSAVAAAVVVSALLNLYPGLTAGSPNAALAPILTAMILLGSLALLSPRKAIRLVGLVLAVAGNLWLFFSGIVVGKAGIDVFTDLQGATRQLLHGENPYFGYFLSDTPGVHAMHFQYEAGALLLTIPGRILGDVRFAELAMVGLLLLAIFMLARRWLSGGREWWVLGAVLASPLPVHMIILAWIEVSGVTGVALWLWLRERHRWVATLALGLGISGSFLALPLLIVSLVRFPKVRLEVGVALGIVVLISAPFALWTGVGHYLYDIGLVQLHLPWSKMALGLNPVWESMTGAAIPMIVSLGLPVVLLIWMSRRFGWSLADSLIVGSLFCMSVVLLAKFAFFNYYFVVVFGLFMALASGYGNVFASQDDVLPTSSLKRCSGR